jgi:hypothetical protein
MEMHITSHKHGTHIVYFDIDDGEKIKKHKWFLTIQKRLNYAYTCVYRDNKRTTLKMHRLIMGNPIGKDIDHINGNGLDNRRLNLRICSRAENARNIITVRLNNTSGYRGVSYHNRCKKYVARIGLKKKKIYIGYYNTALEAAKAYNKAAIKYHGKFSRLNILND